MREILFRGKRLDKGEWIEGYYIARDQPFHTAETSGLTYKVHYITKYNIDTLIWEDIEIDPSTLSQYTGLTDKNGNKIFEGDIISEKVNNVKHLVKWDKERAKYVICRIHRSHCEFGVDYLMNDKIEVIGNKWDNPELLKESE